MAARVAIASFVLVTMSLAQSQDDSSCKIEVKTDKKTKYDLRELQMPSNNPFRFYTSTNLHKVNFCGAAACSSVGATASPGCKQELTAQDGQGETLVGTYQSFASADLLPSDIQDVNFKTKGNPQYDASNTKGIKLYYYPPGQAPQGGQPQYGQQSQPQGSQQFPGPQQPPQTGYSPPPPPPSTGGWPGGRRLMQWGNPPPPPPAQADPYGGQSPPGYGQQAATASSSKAMTVFVICNPDMSGQLPKPIVFGPGMDYSTRNGGYLFVVEHYAGCPVSENFIERAAGGLGWGWTFIICLAVLLVIYCGCGIFYKTKKLGVTGIEAIPNIEFWRDYPSIVKEGCSYSVATVMNCVGKGSGYSAV